MTTRKFDLDTRAGWIEHHHVDFSRSIFSVPREGMIPVGPGDYNPKEIAKHVPTPSLGGSQSSISTIAPLTFGSSSKVLRNVSPRRGNDDNRNEFVTIFHDYDARQPIDTKLRYYPSDGPNYYEPATMLSELNVDGKRTLKKIDFTSTPRFHGMYDKPVLPHYDVNFDSKHLKPRTKLGFMGSSKRLPIKIGENDRSLEVVGPACYRHDHHTKMANISPPRSPADKPGTATMPISPIRRPQLKHLPRNEFSFDASCYTEMKKELVFDLSPGSISTMVPKNMFGHLMAVPRPHRTRSIK